MTDQSGELKRAAELIKMGNKAAAREIVMAALREQHGSQQAWLMMAACAQNREEFALSLGRVLALNPDNQQAIRLAKKYDLPIPTQSAQASKAAIKKIGPNRGKRRGGRMRRILLLLLLLSIALFVAWFVKRPSDEADSEPIAATEEAALPIAEATDAPDSTAEPTEQPQEIATEEAMPAATSELEATDLPEESAQAATEQATPDAPLIDPNSLVTGFQIMAGQSKTAEELMENTFYTPDSPLNLVLDIAEHPERLTLNITLTPIDGDQRPISILRRVRSGPAQTLIIPLKSADDGWALGEWETVIIVNDAALESETFIILPGEVGDILPSANQATLPPLLPDLPPTLRLVYDAKTVYLINLLDIAQDISELRFTQTPEPDEVVSFAAIEWQSDAYSGPGSVYALQPESCFQVGVDTLSASVQAGDCLRLNQWRPRGPESQFWILNNGNVPTFSVLQGEVEIAVCEINAGVCEFALR